MPRRDEGYFTAKDGTRLHEVSLLPDGEPADLIGIVHGYGDHKGRFARTMEALVARGHGVMAFDYRGHGLADGPRADVTNWYDYVADLEAFWGRLRERAAGKPTFLLAHSHGALIATHWLLRRPDGLKAIVLGSPFYALALQPPALKLVAAWVIRRVLPGLRLGNELSPEQFSRDEAWQRETAADPLRLTVTTPRWFFGCQAAQQALAGRGREITVPVLMTGGSADPVVSTPAGKAFFETIGSSDKTYKEYDGYRHELLNELGREQVLNDISQWISAHR